MTRKRNPSSGPKVFVPHDGESRPIAVVAVGGKLLKCRMAGGKPIKTLSADEYADGANRPAPPKGAA